MSRPRVEAEIEELRRGGQSASLHEADQRAFVLYRDVPTAGAKFGLPLVTDVVVPVPDGYPGAPIDLAGLPLGSPFLARVKGGSNNQGHVSVAGSIWQLASYHPHSNGGGPAWNQLKHGFHTYFGELLAWLARID